MKINSVHKRRLLSPVTLRFRLLSLLLTSSFWKMLFNYEIAEVRDPSYNLFCPYIHNVERGCYTSNPHLMSCIIFIDCYNRIIVNNSLEPNFKKTNFYTSDNLWQGHCEISDVHSNFTMFPEWKEVLLNSEIQIRVNVRSFIPLLKK